jgi:hypothetical protein
MADKTFSTEPRDRGLKT